jgi:hypothetical protein
VILNLLCYKSRLETKFLSSIPGGNIFFAFVLVLYFCPFLSAKKKYLLISSKIAGFLSVKLEILINLLNFKVEKIWLKKVSEKMPSSFGNGTHLEG